MENNVFYLLSHSTVWFILFTRIMCLFDTIVVKHLRTIKLSLKYMAKHSITEAMMLNGGQSRVRVSVWDYNFILFHFPSREWMREHMAWEWRRMCEHAQRRVHVRCCFSLCSRLRGVGHFGSRHIGERSTLTFSFFIPTTNPLSPQKLCIFKREYEHVFSVLIRLY